MLVLRIVGTLWSPCGHILARLRVTIKRLPRVLSRATAMLRYRAAAFLTRCERPSDESPQADLGGIIAVRSLPKRPFNERRPVGRIGRIVPVDLGGLASAWPIHSWIARSGAPAAAICVPKGWRSSWNVIAR